MRPARLVGDRLTALRERIATPALQAHAPLLVTTAIFGIAVFIVLGNALAALSGFPRRETQALVLLVCVLTYWIFARPEEAWGSFVAMANEKPFLVGLGVLCLPLAIACAWGLRFNPGFGAAAISPLLWTLAWLAILWSATVTAIRFRRKLMSKVARESARTRWEFLAVVTAIGFFLALAGWWLGPPEKESFISFGGSVIFTALCGSVGMFTLLFCFQKRYALLASLPFGYLIVFSTSRTGQLLLLTMLVLFALVAAARRPKPIFLIPFRAIASYFLPLMATLAFVFIPVHFESRFYPYYTEVENTDVIPYRVAELYSRIRRTFRALNAVGIDLEGTVISTVTFVSGLSDFGKRFFPTGDIESFLASQEALAKDIQRSIQVSGRVDERWTLVVRSWDLVTTNPMGYWPTQFRDIVNVTCATNILCDYPHNFILDVAFYFGWVTAGILFIGFAVFTLLLLFLLVLKRSLIGGVICVGLLNYLIGMQVTGTFGDTFIPFLLVAIWIIETHRPEQGPEIAWNSKTPMPITNP